jgi:hypothetical protein
MRWRLPLFALALTSTAAIAGEPGSSPQQEALMACATRALPDLDDKISAASVVAKAITERCDSELRSFAIATYRVQGGKGDVWRVMVGLKDGDIFVPLVLQYRARSLKNLERVPALDRKDDLSTNGGLVALCDDASETAKLMCDTYLRGWLDAYIWESHGRCVNPGVDVSRFREIYLANLKTFPPDTVKRLSKDFPGGALLFLAEQNSHICK